MAGPSVYFTRPFPLVLIPEPLPRTVPPPVGSGDLRAPFTIPTDVYNSVLRPELPITFAASYIVIVLLLNAHNRRRKNKPWWISRQPAFRYFVVIHNVVLALYSAVTFVAMLRAISRVWPGWMPEHPSATYADTLCQMNGPRGLGSAAIYNTTLNIWQSPNTIIRMARNGMPDYTDVGRMWNEGLAFWGWLFYVSKFYEVVDTLVILAKGKRSPTLQTYHHAGAMLCMWSGIRYMSPPIWMFVFLNSGIHAMMYTYFTLSALGYRVPQHLKRTLTSLQIAQFVFGASYAALHLFVQYDIPVSAPYEFMSTVERAVSRASSAVSTFAEAPTPAVGWSNLAKKLLLRAAGEEGPAERIGRETGTAVASAVPHISQAAQKAEKVYDKIFETRWRNETTRVNCINTSGEAFAIYLNLVYLAPLTGLFARFFYKAYHQRGRARTASQVARATVDAAKQAQRDTKNSIEKAGVKAEEQIAKADSRAESKATELQEQVKKDVQAHRKGEYSSSSSTTTQRVSEKVSQTASFVEEKLSQSASFVEEKLSESASVVEEKLSQSASYVSEVATQAKDQAKEVINNANESRNSPEPSTPERTPGKRNKKKKDKGPLQKPELKTPSRILPPQKSPGGGLFRSINIDDSEEQRSQSSTTKTESELSQAESSTTRDTEYSASAEREQESGERKEKDPSQSAGDADSTAQDEVVQDETLADSQALRPDPVKDSDAMGASGIDISSVE